ncbi:MAG: HNH endonuclease [Chloroflexi bacterium]|nr:HNH endonuclease [Chloroflexota bacterium]
MINYPVLVLNQNYEPLMVCRARRAVVLIFQGKAEMLEDGVGLVHSATSSFPLPSVIRLGRQVKRPRQKKRLTRLEVFNRDHHTCQYCGRQSHQLSLDHIIPRYRGGPHTWENVVSACIPCNRKKAGRTPQEANMLLITRPVAPTGNGMNISRFCLEDRDKWQKYLFQ